MIRYDIVLGYFRKIFCECDACGEVFRLSDTEIKANEKPDQDWLSRIDSKISTIERQIERAESAFAIKQRTVIDRQRKLVERSTFNQIKNLIPNFAKVLFNTRDMKAIGYPVKFISFDGKDVGNTEKIRFIDFTPETKEQAKRLRYLDSAIQKERYDWKTLRIEDSGRVTEE